MVNKSYEHTKIKKEPKEPKFNSLTPEVPKTSYDDDGGYIENSDDDDDMYETVKETDMGKPPAVPSECAPRAARVRVVSVCTRRSVCCIRGAWCQKPCTAALRPVVLGSAAANTHRPGQGAPHRAVRRAWAFCSDAGCDPHLDCR